MRGAWLWVCFGVHAQSMKPRVAGPYLADVCLVTDENVALVSCDKATPFGPTPGKVIAYVHLLAVPPSSVSSAESMRSVALKSKITVEKSSELGWGGRLGGFGAPRLVIDTAARHGPRRGPEAGHLGEDVNDLVHEIVFRPSLS